VNNILRNALTIAGLATAGAVAALVAPAAAHAADAPATASASARQLDHDYQQQENGYYCGPSATRVALSAQGKNLSQDKIAQQLGTTENGTNSSEDITRVLNAELGAGKYHTVEISSSTPTPKQTDQLKTDIVTGLSQGKPVVANIAGTITDADGETHSYEGGHYIPVVAYDDGGDTVTIADSADKVGSPYYKISTDQLAEWIATRGYAA
jgi:hypothetical protein